MAAADEVDTINLAVVGITTNYKAIRNSLTSIESMCTGLASIPLVGSSACDGIPSASSLPPSIDKFQVCFNLLHFSLQKSCCLTFNK